MNLPSCQTIHELSGLHRAFLKVQASFVRSRSKRHEIRNRFRAVRYRYVQHPDAPFAFVSYIGSVFSPKADPATFIYHTNLWEARCIGEVLLELGYNVDFGDYLDEAFTPERPYDLAFDNTGHLGAWADKLGPDCVKVAYVTTAYPPVSNAAEQERVKALEARRPGACYLPRRQMKETLWDASLRCADRVLLIDDGWSRSTFPQDYLKQADSVLPTFGEPCSSPEKAPDAAQHFFWMGGGGCVHKGLDWLLEIVAKHPEWHLHMAGAVRRETDFCRIYEKELALPNVHMHGYISPESAEFAEICRRCAFFVCPSGSEGVCVAALTAIAAGLYPILSYQTGVSLPEGVGCTLPRELSLQVLEQAMAECAAADASERAAQCGTLQAWVRSRASREAFREHMRAFFKGIKEGRKS